MVLIKLRATDSFLAAGRPALIREFIKTPKKLSERRDIIKHAKILLGNASSYEALAAVYTYSTNRDQALKLIDVIVTLIRFSTDVTRPPTGSH